ncbi:MlaD family protein [Shewanella litorisediminis]|uniref:MCE family protein n=1 Tax=Shewanella litorisediminis TaxID=1173586 RepID=A0ABX7G7E6_9GAMM|nr:MlaD family protein [Shewanella litorisediminis]MCL2919771.1 MlaD family protein [Shewanella litorisediminis]QRH03287.1 MCE family protein [Shewanella litorisediminis]
MTNIEAPKVVKKKLFSPVWLLPLVALALAAWLGIKSIRESGVEIFVHFPSASGIDVGKTLVKYQGLTVGKVTDIAMDEDLKGVNVTVMMDYRAAPYLRENTQFWLVSPKASITGVSGLDALFSGNYIAVQPGDGEQVTRFDALREAPPMAPGNEGILVELSTDKLGSLDVGSGVYFRQIPVGNVVSYRLEGNQRIVIGAFIQEQYAHLVKKDSRFWNVSGMSIDASLKGIKVESESLAALLAGGISFSSSDAGISASHGDSFVLHGSETDALGGYLLELTTDNADGLGVGSLVMYRGLEIGKVTNTRLTDSGVSLSVFINHAQGHLIGKDSRFWREGADISLDGIKHAARLITGDVIAMLPGEGPMEGSYILESKAPDFMYAEKAHLLIRSDTGQGAQVGAEIRYRNLPVGEVTQVKLAEDLGSVEYLAEIQPEFKRLLTRGSYLVAEAPVSLDASLKGVKFAVGDTSALLKGSIKLVSGSGTALGAQDELRLYASEEDALAAKATNQRIKIKLQSTEGAGIEVSSPVYYKKMHIGEVTHVSWQPELDVFDIELAIDGTFKRLIGPNTLYWKHSAISVDASLKGLKVDVATLPGLISGGIAIGLLPQGEAKNPGRLYESETLAMAQAQPVELIMGAESRIAAGAPIRYQGHQIGEVTEVKLSSDLHKLVARAYLYGEYADNFSREDSRYLLEDVQISLQGIKAPEAIITGPFISVLPGKAPQRTHRFEVVGRAPHYANVATDALKLTLERPSLGSIKAGSQIFYRGVAIGGVDGYALNSSGSQVELFVHIDAEYRHLVNASSVFFDLSGVNFEFGLFSGAKVQTGSLETILVGGIGVATRSVTAAGNQLGNGSRFVLYPEAHEDWLVWSPQ